MAKVKRSERLTRMRCGDCKRAVYASKNKKKVERKLELKKYCEWCLKRTTFKESRK